MTWDPVWERIFASREWGRYPPEELIRFTARHFYDVAARRDVHVLELGCGPGPNLWYLAREGFGAAGIDASPTAIEQARERLAAEGLEAELVVGDIARIGKTFAGRLFDAVVDVACLQHNEPPVVQRVIGEAKTLLRPGGRLFSMLVARGSYGEGLGREVGDGTWSDVAEGPLAGAGLTHFWSLDEVERLAAVFADAEVERSQRTYGGRRHVYAHWVLDAEIAG